LRIDPVSDDFLLTIAEISAGLTGLFLVGMIFYIQSGIKQHKRSRGVVEPYFRAATLITFIAYGIPLAVSLTLVSLPIIWSRLLYSALVVSLIVADVSTVSTVRAVMRVTRLRLLVVMEVVGTAVVALMAILPMATGGLSPDREDLVPAILLSLGIGFLGTCVLVITLFDIARYERSAPPPRSASSRSPKQRANDLPRDATAATEPSSTEKD
jgi:hypothetical protein